MFVGCQYEGTAGGAPAPAVVSLAVRGRGGWSRGRTRRSVRSRQSNWVPADETLVQGTVASWLPATPGDAPAVLLDELRPSRALERGRLAFRGDQRPPIGISGGLFDHPFAARRVVTIYVDD